MKLEGVHHITCITADAQRNVDFYAGTLGLCFVKKTVNFDAPEFYHLYYGDDLARPGSLLTFFEYPGAPPGRPGAGAIHRLVWRVGDIESIAFWDERLSAAGVDTVRQGGGLLFSDPEGLGLEILAVETDDAPLTATSPDIPEHHALQGFHGVRAHTDDAQRSRGLLQENLGFDLQEDDTYAIDGDERHGRYLYDIARWGANLEGAGSVHHIAWGCRDEEQEEWRQRALAGGARVTEVIDRQYFHSIYFREPSGVLFEIATLSPGFAVDEPLEHLGESLCLPPMHEHLRAHLEQRLTPLKVPGQSV